MARLFDGKTDIMMSLDGDLVLGTNGDFLLTSGFDWLAREVNKIIRTVNPEWQAHPFIGAGVEEFGGRSNTKETGIQIQRQIKSAIDRANLLDFGQEVNVRVIPTDLESAAIIISVSIASTKTIVSKLLFDFKDGVVQEVEDIQAGYLEEQDDNHRYARTNVTRTRLRKR